jgi:hypothetical protein
MSCDGRGNCLEQWGFYRFRKNTCPKKCKPVNCPKCNCRLPLWVLDCNEGLCMNCAVEEFCSKIKDKNDEDPINPI